MLGLLRNKESCSHHHCYDDYYYYYSTSYKCIEQVGSRITHNTKSMSSSFSPSVYNIFFLLVILVCEMVPFENDPISYFGTSPLPFCRHIEFLALVIMNNAFSNRQTRLLHISKVAQFCVHVSDVGFNRNIQILFIQHFCEKLTLFLQFFHLFSFSLHSQNVGEWERARRAQQNIRIFVETDVKYCNGIYIRTICSQMQFFYLSKIENQFQII